jgi:hypothetical protein
MSDLRGGYIEIKDVFDDGSRTIDDPFYAYHFYDDEGSIFGVQNDFLELVVKEVNEGNVVEFLRRNHPEFLQRAIDDGDSIFVFNGTTIGLPVEV